ncbi:MAG: exodeoxyribonuclease III, partial [Leptospiraceae bacterium]|nr:exodeoxyribonuclease III [Leptospiraceae bacterium]
MKLLSINCNGIRSAFSKGFDKYIEEDSFDMISLQEVKANEEDADIEFFKSLGYKPFYHPAEKKGYSGTAIFTKHEPISSKIGIGIEEYDKEGRFIELEFKHFTLMNCYFPSGTSGDERQEFKMRFLGDINNY